MSEETESIEFETANLKTLSHRRILFLMGFIAVLGSIGGVAFISRPFGIGFLLGGILAFVNYYWLKHTLKVIFEQAKQGEKPLFAGSRYLLRYCVIGLILLIASLTRSVSVVALILGLTSFALAIVIEGLIRIFASLFNK